MKTSTISSFFLQFLLVSLICWVSVMPFPHHPGQTPHHKGATFDSKHGVVDQKSFERVKEKYEGEKYNRRLGSIPPNCAHRCKGCVPCVPIKIAKTTGRIEVQYTNYMPEGWRCKCGSTFFNP